MRGHGRSRQVSPHRPSELLSAVRMDLSATKADRLMASAPPMIHPPVYFRVPYWLTGVLWRPATNLSIFLVRSCDRHAIAITLGANLPISQENVPNERLLQ